MKQERHAAIINEFSDVPEAQEILKLQLDEEGYNAFTNQELAGLLSTTVSDVENRKKRVKTRLLSIRRRLRRGNRPMPKRDSDRLFEQIRKMADRLTAGDDTKPNSQLASELRMSGVDPDALKSRFHEAAKRLAATGTRRGAPCPACTPASNRTDCPPTAKCQ